MSATTRRIFLLLSIGIVLTVTIYFVVRRHSVHTSASLPQTRSSNAKSVDPADFAMAAEGAVSELQDGITVSHWKANHVGQDKEILTEPSTSECVSLKSEARLSDGARIIRLVTFYPPPAPTPAVLPNLRGQRLIDETCVLGQIRIETSVPSADAGHAITEAVEHRFVTNYGLNAEKKSKWQTAIRWQFGKLEIASDYDAKPGLNPDAPGQLIQGPLVYVNAKLPIPELAEMPAPPRPDRSRLLAEFHQAVATTNIDASISVRMEKLYAMDVTVSDAISRRLEEMCKVKCPGENELPKPVGKEWREPLVPVLHDWLEALKQVGPDRRAAGLLAADSLLTAFAGIRGRLGEPFGTEDLSTDAETELRSRLQKLGATFAAYAPDGRVYTYAGNWLEEASQLAPESNGGRMAALAWMSSQQCQGPERIISLGEKLLATNIDAQTASKVHFLVGDAYSDMVAGAAGVLDVNGADYADEYKGKADSARSKALEHYTAGLASDTASEKAKAAWLQAWHLYAGLLPDAHYLCVGD